MPASSLSLAPSPRDEFAVSSVDRILTSPLLERWSDPRSGVHSYLLAERAAPVQQSFYFVNPSLTNDGRYFWFYCAFPPAGSANQGRSLAVADFQEGEIHHFSETAFSDCSPLVDRETGECYWCSGLEILKRSPDPSEPAVVVNRFPDTLSRNRRPWRLATHLTFSADRQAVNLDVEIGREWYVGHAPLDGSPFELWQKLDRCYNHAQFSPVDPDLQLLAQDHSVNPMTGEIEHYQNRLWLIRRGEVAEPLYSTAIPTSSLRHGATHQSNDAARIVTDARGMHGHEWWGRDGRHIWYLHYGNGVKRHTLSDSTVELLWPHLTLSHAHADARGNWLVADNLPPDHPEEHKVLFRNLQTGREVEIVSHLPVIPRALSRYHVHPHPQFCLNDQLICYTTTVRGSVDVAFVSVDQLLAHTA